MYIKFLQQKVSINDNMACSIIHQRSTGRKAVPRTSRSKFCKIGLMRLQMMLKLKLSPTLKFVQLCYRHSICSQLCNISHYNKHCNWPTVWPLIIQSPVRGIVWPVSSLDQRDQFAKVCDLCLTFKPVLGKDACQVLATDVYWLQDAEVKCKGEIYCPTVHEFC